MARAESRQKKPEARHTFLTLQVEHYDALLEAEVNHHVYAPQYAWRTHDDDPLFTFDSRLSITGTSIRPDKRAKDTYELTLRGAHVPPYDLEAKVKDGSLPVRLLNLEGHRGPVSDLPELPKLDGYDEGRIKRLVQFRWVISTRIADDWCPSQLIVTAIMAVSVYPKIRLGPFYQGT